LKRVKHVKMVDNMTAVKREKRVKRLCEAIEVRGVKQLK
jgi:hypothetical protein